MLFRKRLFTALAVLSLLYVLGGLVLVGGAAANTSAENPYGGASASAYNLGIGLGAATLMTVVFCTGLPMLLLFSLLAWRNGAGLRAERRHQKQLAALQGKT